MAVLSALCALLTSACSPEIPGGRFRCQLGEADPCPPGYACKPFGASHYCFASWQATCDNGILEPGEKCDSQLFNGGTCRDFYPEVFTDPAAEIPQPRCAPGCVVWCGVCGDEVVDDDRGEQCDGAAPPGKTCLDFGFDQGRLGCTSGCSLDFTGCRRLGFSPEPASTSARLADLWAASEDNAVAVGAHGTLLRFEGNGWEAVASGTSADLEAVWGTSPSHVMAAGFEGTVLRFDGSTWDRLTNPYPLMVRSIWGSSPDNVFLVSSYNRILRFDGQQISDFPHDQSIPVDALRGVWGSGPDDVIVVGTNGIILRYDGQGWTNQPSPTNSVLRSVWGTGPDNILVVGDHGTLLRFDGVQWVSECSGTGSHLRRVFGTGPENVFAAGDDGTLLHFDGRHWAPVSTDSIEHLYALGGAGPGQVFAAGNRGTILRSSGSFWRLLDSGTNTGFYGAWGDARRGILLVGKGGLSIRHEGGPTLLDTGASASLMAVWGQSSRNLLAVGVNGTILQYRDGWTRMGSPTNEHLYGVWGSSPSNAWAVGNAGTILHYNGDRWSTSQEGEEYHLKALWGRGDETVFAAGSGGTILHFEGSAWEPMESGSTEPLRALWGSAPDDVFAAGDNGTLLHYDGIAWSAMASPTSSHLLALFGTSHEDVFACGESGVLLHFDGSAWSPVRTRVGVSLQAMTGDARDLFIAGDQGILLRLRRNVAWLPTEIEVACGDGMDNDGDGRVDACDSDCAASTLEDCSDGMDNDCDGLSDCADPDCRGAMAEACGDGQDNDCDGLADCADPDCATHQTCAGPCGWPYLRLSEVHGGLVDYIEIANQGSCPFDLAGLGLSYRLDTNAQAVAISGSTPVPPGGVVRLLGSVTDREPGERQIGALLDDTPDGEGWVALCQGPCDLDGCSNVLDYFEKAGSSLPVEPPTCATFAPRPLDVSSLGGVEETQESAVRVAFDGVGPVGLFSDWAVGPASRDYGMAGPCQPWAPIQCGESVTGSTATARRALVRYGCFGFEETGPEKAYRLEVSSDTHLIATLGGLTADLDLVLVGAIPTGACDPEGQCLASSWQDGLVDEPVELEVSAGDVIYLLVEGYEGARGSFELSVICENP